MQFTARCMTPPCSTTGVKNRQSCPAAILAFTLAPIAVTACPERTCSAYPMPFAHRSASVHCRFGSPDIAPPPYLRDGWGAFRDTEEPKDIIRPDAPTTTGTARRSVTADDDAEMPTLAFSPPAREARFSIGARSFVPPRPGGGFHPPRPSPSPSDQRMARARSSRGARLPRAGLWTTTREPISFPTAVERESPRGAYHAVKDRSFLL